MKKFSILGTNHTSFTVSHLDRTISYFTDVLGFELLNRSKRDPAFIEKVVAIPGANIEVAYLQAPNHRLELISYSSPENRSIIDCRPCDSGFAHIAFDVDDISAVISESIKAGVHPLGEPQDLDRGPNKGGKVVYTRDSDGITIEFIQPPLK